jgi:uncharacterized protein
VNASSSKRKNTSWAKAVCRFERIGKAGHTFFFGLADGRVIDGGQSGNSVRWLNHSCAANCESIEVGKWVAGSHSAASGIPVEWH